MLDKKPATTTDVHGYQQTVREEVMAKRKQNQQTNKTSPQEENKSPSEQPQSNEVQRSGTDKSR
jgi:hypothetical protein